MNIQNIRQFSIIAELENVSKAAELLHVSQSSLSKNISNLEAELGVKLFDRKGRKLVLNEQGRRFLESCTVILREADELSRDIRSMSASQDSTIKICTASCSREFINCIKQFKTVYNKTEYVINSLWESGEVPDINDYDVIVYPDDPKYDKFKGSNFQEERYLFAISSKNDLARRISMPVKEMDGLDFVFIREGHNTEYAYRVCTALTVNMNTVSFVDSRDVHKNMIASGMGAGFVPESNAELYRQGGTIRLLPLTDNRFDRRMKICFKRDKHLSETGLLFKKFVIEYFKLDKE